jgi:hypothetical protein
MTKNNPKIRGLDLAEVSRTYAKFQHRYDSRCGMDIFSGKDYKTIRGSLQTEKELPLM